MSLECAGVAMLGLHEKDVFFVDEKEGHEKNKRKKP